MSILAGHFFQFTRHFFGEESDADFYSGCFGFVLMHSPFLNDSDLTIL